MIYVQDAFRVQKGQIKCSVPQKKGIDPVLLLSYMLLITMLLFSFYL